MRREAWGRYMLGETLLVLFSLHESGWALNRAVTHAYDGFSRHVQITQSESSVARYDLRMRYDGGGFLLQSETNGVYLRQYLGKAGLELSSGSDGRLARYGSEAIVKRVPGQL